MRVAWGLEEGQEGPIPNGGSHRAPAWGWIILTVGVGEGVGLGIHRCCSVIKSCLFANPWTAACQASLSFTISQSLLKLMPIESAMPSNHLVLCCSLLLPPSIFPSIRVFFQ